MLLVSLTAFALVATAAPAPKPSIVVTRVQARQGVSADAADLLTGALVSSVKARNVFSRVMSPAQIESVLDLEKQRQLTDCGSEGCMAEIAGALGVDYVLTCAVGGLGTVFIVNATLVKARSGEIAASVSRTIQEGGMTGVAQSFDEVVVELLVAAKMMSSAAADHARDAKTLKEAESLEGDRGGFSFRPWMAVGLATCAAVPLAPICLGASVGLLLGSTLAYGQYATRVSGTLNGTDPFGSLMCGLSAASCLGSFLFLALSGVSFLGTCGAGGVTLVMWILDRVFFNVTEKLENATGDGDPKPRRKGHKKRRRAVEEDDDED